MTVVRYTFDICLRDGLNKDTYSMGSLIEKSILGTNGVCGCEIAHKACEQELGYNSVNIYEAIKWQRSKRQWIGEKGGAK